MTFTPDQLNSLYRYCLALTREPNSAYDLLHQGIVRMLERGTDGVLDRRAFLVTILRNLHFDQRKSAAARFEVIDGDASEHAPDAALSPLDDLLIQAEDVERLLAGTTAEERELLYMTAVEERTAQEVADLLSLPRGTVLARMHRLRKRLVATFQRDREARR